MQACFIFVFKFSSKNSLTENSKPYTGFIDWNGIIIIINCSLNPPSLASKIIKYKGAYSCPYDLCNTCVPAHVFNGCFQLSIQHLRSHFSLLISIKMCILGFKWKPGVYGDTISFTWNICAVGNIKMAAMVWRQILPELFSSNVCLFPPPPQNPITGGGGKKLLFF